MRLGLLGGVTTPVVEILKEWKESANERYVY